MLEEILAWLRLREREREVKALNLAKWLAVGLVIFDFVTPDMLPNIGRFEVANAQSAGTPLPQYPFVSNLPQSPRALVEDQSGATGRFVYFGNGSGNILDNGDMIIDQANAGASVTLTSSNSVNYRAPDRWLNTFFVSGGSAGNPTAQQVTIATGLAHPISPKELKITGNSSAGTSTPAGSYGYVLQSIEGADVEDLLWGTSAAYHVGVSIAMKASVAGTYGVALQPAGAGISYVHDCVVAAATWTYCNFTVQPPTTGTWTMTQGAVGINFYITHTCGSTYQSTLAQRDSWATGAFYCSPSQTQLTNNASATLEITQVTMTRGPGPSEFVPMPFSRAMDRARHFYQTSFPIGTAPAQNAGVGGAVCSNAPSNTAATLSEYVSLVPPLYAAPTITTYNPSASNAKWRDVTGSADNTQSVDPATAKSAGGFQIAETTDAMTAGHVMCIHYVADSGL